MRWIILFFVFTSCLPLVIGQPGFNKRYNLGEPLALFFDCIYVGGDTVATYGIGYSSGIFSQQQGLLFAQFDTNGNEIRHRLYFDSLGMEYTTYTPASFLKLKDGSGFLLLSDILDEPNTCLLLKLDNDGNLISKIHIPDTTDNLTKIHCKIIEIGTSFYVAGIAQRVDYQTDLFLMRLDNKGHKKWEKYFGTNSRSDNLNSLWGYDANEIVLGASTSNLPGTPDSKINFTSKIFAIDSLGNTKWNWESPFTKEEIGPVGLFKSEDGQWCYTSKYTIYNGSWYYQHEFIKRDSNFNLVFRKRVEKPRLYAESIHLANTSFQTQDNGWFAAGQIAAIQEYNAYAGFTCKLDSNDEIMWYRLDTAQAATWLGCDNQLYSAVELPGGSIIACGSSMQNFSSTQNYGWLLKIDRNGCVDTLNCMPVSTIQQPEYARPVKVYPNPVSDFIHIDVADAMDFERYEIVSVAGRLVDRGKYMPQIPVSDLPPGAYVLRLFRGEEVLCRKTIKM